MRSERVCCWGLRCMECLMSGPAVVPEPVFSQPQSSLPFHPSKSPRADHVPALGGHEIHVIRSCGATLVTPKPGRRRPRSTAVTRVASVHAVVVSGVARHSKAESTRRPTTTAQRSGCRGATETREKVDSTCLFQPPHSSVHCQ